MLGGLGGYILISGYFKQLSFGMHPVVMGITISLVAYVAVTLLTPPPSSRVLQLYWGKGKVTV
ncbi:MAG TPA: hypothetical protein GX511_03465 [Firmicutes bacterium]|nr:hypothetical protein [Bacillota bacterium]